MTSTVPRNWRIDQCGAEIILIFAARGGKGYLLGLAVGVGSFLLLGYGIGVFAKGWVIDREEVLPGGVVLFLLLVLALLFPVYIFNRLLYAETRYRLSPDALIAQKKSLFGGKALKIPKSEAVSVSQVMTPPRLRGMDDTWRTLLFYGDARHPKSFSFEGYSREECDWLAPQISAWGKIPCRVESTTDDAEA